MAYMNYSGQVSINGQATFVGYVQDGWIYANDPTGQQVVGVTKKSYDELKEDYESVKATSQKYYDKLVELGVIQPKLTLEELVQKQAEALARSEQTQARMLETIENLTKKLESKIEPATSRSKARSGSVPAVAQSDNASE